MDLLSLAAALTAAQTASDTLQQNQTLIESITGSIDEDGNLVLTYTTTDSNG